MTLTTKPHFQILKTRSLVIQAIRDFFFGNQFLEVDTPIRCPGIIPEAQIDPVTSDGFYLQASPELCMKQLLSKGFDNIFQICKTFRKDERGPLHLPELTLLEWYSTHSTYLDLMNQCQALIRFIAEQLGCGNPIQYQGKAIDLNLPWQRLTVEKAFDLYADMSCEAALKEKQFDEIISFQIEPHLGNKSPVFLMDYPASLASLAQLKPNDPGFAQRVEFYISGIELANGFTELTDPIEQKTRFDKENSIRRHQGKEPLPLPAGFLKNLESMPPAAGMAMGVDRLVMIFSDAAFIDQVVAFTPEEL
ncbi:MAG: EF-P lysine aminoacylase EpmA [Pseudomonadota bacterium]